jgi:hypothetical protein
MVGLRVCLRSSSLVWAERWVEVVCGIRRGGFAGVYLLPFSTVRMLGDHTVPSASRVPSVGTMFEQSAEHSRSLSLLMTTSISTTKWKFLSIGSGRYQ